MPNDDSLVIDAIGIAEKVADKGSTVDGILDAMGLLTPCGNGMTRRELTAMLAELKRENRVQTKFHDGKMLYSPR